MRKPSAWISYSCFHFIVGLVKLFVEVCKSMVCSIIKIKSLSSSLQDTLRKILKLLLGLVGALDEGLCKGFFIFHFVWFLSC